MAAPIKPEFPEAAIDELITTIAERLDSAEAVAKAAVTCMEAGNRKQAVIIVTGMQELLMDVNTFLSAATLIKRKAEL